MSNHLTLHRVGSDSPKVIPLVNGRCLGACPGNEARADPSPLKTVDRDKLLQSSNPQLSPLLKVHRPCCLGGPLPRCLRQPCGSRTSWVKGKRLCPAVLRRVTASPTALSSLPRSSLSAASQLPAVCQQLLRDINNQPLAEAPWQRRAGAGLGGGDRAGWPQAGKKLRGVLRARDSGLRYSELLLRGTS